MPNSLLPSIPDLNKQAEQTQKDRLQMAQKGASLLKQKMAPGGQIRDPHAERKIQFNAPQYTTPYVQQDTPTAGIDPNWDYKTAKLNPNGEGLDKYPGAVGWTKYGEPYYGMNSPFREFVDKNARHNRIWKDLSADTVANLKQQRADTFTKAGELFSQGDILQGALTGLNGVMQTFSDILPRKLSNFLGQKDNTIEKGNFGDFVIRGSRLIGDDLMAAGLAIDHFLARPLKQGVNAIDVGIEDALLASGIKPADKLLDFYNPLISDDINKLPDGFLKSSEKWVQGLFQKVSPVKWVINTFKLTKGLITGQVNENVSDREIVAAWNAGRVMYTSFIDPAVQEEYKRRYLAGENPYLLEQELENPLAEAVGEAIFDPSNYIFSGAALKRVESTFSKSVEYLGQATQETASMVNKFTNATDVVEGDLTKLAKGVGQSIERIQIEKVGQSERKLFGFFNLTPQGQQNHVQRLASTIIANDLVHVQKNPTEWYNIMKARAALASSNIAKREEAIKFLMGAGLPLDNVLSEGSLMFSKTISGLYFTDAGELNRKFLDGMLEIIGNEKMKAVDKIDGIHGIFDREYRTALEKAFPLLNERKELNGAQKLLKPLEKTMNREGLPGKIYGWVNKAASKVWLGLSPGFASRNWIANKFHIFSDFGIEGLEASMAWHRADNLSTLERIFGDNIPEFMQQGYGSLGKLVEPMKAEENIKLTDWLGNNLKRSGIYEGRDRVAITAYAIKSDWNQNGAKIVLNPALLREGGLSEDVINTATNILDLEYGNWERAYPKIVEALGENTNAAKAFGYLDANTKEWMRSYNMLDTFTDGVRKATTKEEALKVLDNIEEQIRRLGKTVDGDEVLPDLEDASLRGTEFLGDYRSFENFSTNEALNSLFARSKMANRNAEDSAYQMLEELRNYVGKLEGVDKDGNRVKLFDLDAVVSQDETLQKISNHTFLNDTLFKQRGIKDSFEGHIKALRKSGAGQAEIDAAYEMVNNTLGLKLVPPKNANPRQVAVYLFEHIWYPQQRQAFAVSRDTLVTSISRLVSEASGAVAQAGQQLPETTGRRFKRVFADWMSASSIDNAISTERNGVNAMRKLTPESYNNYQAVAKMAYNNGIDLAYLKDGHVVFADNHFLKAMEKYTGVVYERASDVPLEEARKMFQARALERGEDFVDVAGDFKEAGQTIENISGVYDRGGQTIGNGVPYYEAMPELKPRIEKLRQQITENWSKKTKAISDDNVLETLQNWGTKHVKPNAYTWRQAATEASRRLGDFALHDYGDQRNFDLILGMIYPYQFWYSRTYANWAKRIAQNPAILSQYYRYKEYMAKIHAGLPDFYKYQINTNELFGMNAKNPLMFNLEATLSPLYGVTGEDFNDPARRTTWWSSLADGLGRFGPSINPLMQYGIAFAMMARGEEEAASHWGGRLTQYSSTLQSIGAMTGIDWLATTNLDPAVALFGKGEDPWLRSRAGRAAYQMQQEGWKGYTPEQIFDAVRTQNGEIWDEAKIRALQDRGWGQLSSFFLGQGFKPRTQNDISIDQMYQDLYSTINMRPNLSEDEYKQQMQQLGQKYPYMDTVLVSKRIGIERDSAYSWSVLGRIPPGDSFKIYDMVGIDQNIVDKFYANKGDLSKFNESDRNRFMAAMVDIAATLAIPDGMTQQSWDAAKYYYAQMDRQLKTQFPDGIDDKIDLYYALKDAGEDDQATMYLFQNPEVQRAMDFKTAVIVNGPQELQAYYSSLQKINMYYKGKVYAAARIKFGNGIEVLQMQYFNTAPQDRKAFLKEHPKLTEYWDFIHAEQPAINQHVVDVGNRLPQGAPAQIRADFLQQDQSTGATNLYNGLQQQQDKYQNMTVEDWVRLVGEGVVNTAVDALRGQRQLSYKEQKSLDQAAKYAGLYDANELIQRIGMAAQ